MKKVDVTMVAIAIRTVRAVQGETAGSALGQLQDFGFSVRDDYRGVSLAFGGIRATSTAGVHGAMPNWLRAAEAKIGDAA